MKQIIYVLNAILILSCSHSITQSENNASAYQQTHWMDESDYVRYLNFYARTPSSELSTYKIVGDCDGWPKIDVLTAPGFCVGLVYNGEGLRKPRTIAQIDTNEFLIADMGSWSPYDGNLFLLNTANEPKLTALFDTKKILKNDPKREIINRPHQVTKHTDGKFYVGSATAILRFDPKAADPFSTIEVLIQNIPSEGLHALKSFTFDGDNSIYVNVGSATNVCHKFSLGGIFGNRKTECVEVENNQIGQGQIRKYKLSNANQYSKTFEVYAKGLRNSIALTWDFENNALIQGENSRDEISNNDHSLNNEELPHDEINVIKSNKHYGWPYCYDNNVSSPEWKKVNCKNFQKPQLLLPAHSAPLGLHIYNGNLFPDFYTKRLFVSLHGYKAKGHRLVVMKKDDNGLPAGTPQSVVYGWGTKGEQKFGSPVGITEIQDGSLLIVEDTNKKILRLSYLPNEGDGLPIQEIDQAKEEIDPMAAVQEEARRMKLTKKLAQSKVPPFTLFQAKVIDHTCIICHGGVNSPGIQFLKYDDEGNEQKLIKLKKARLMISMVNGEKGFPPMPPQGFNSEVQAKEARNYLKLWLEQNPQIE